MTEQSKKKVEKLIQGKSFDELAEVIEELKKDRGFSLQIKFVIFDRMDALDRERFEEWAETHINSLSCNQATIK